MAKVQTNVRLDYFLSEKLGEYVRKINREANLSGKPEDFTSKEKEIIKLVEEKFKDK